MATNNLDIYQVYNIDKNVDHPEFPLVRMTSLCRIEPLILPDDYFCENCHQELPAGSSCFLLHKVRYLIESFIICPECLRRYVLLDTGPFNTQAEEIFGSEF